MGRNRHPGVRIPLEGSGLKTSGPISGREKAGLGSGRLSRRLADYFLVVSAGGVVDPPGALVPPDADPAGGVASPPLEASEDGADGAGVVVAGGAGGGETCGVGAGVGFGSSLPHPATAKAASAATIIMRFIVFLGRFSEWEMSIDS